MHGTEWRYLNGRELSRRAQFELSFVRGYETPCTQGQLEPWHNWSQHRRLETQMQVPVPLDYCLLGLPLL